MIITSDALVTRRFLNQRMVTSHSTGLLETSNWYKSVLTTIYRILSQHQSFSFDTSTVWKHRYLDSNEFCLWGLYVKWRTIYHWKFNASPSNFIINIITAVLKQNLGISLLLLLRRKFQIQTTQLSWTNTTRFESCLFLFFTNRIERKYRSNNIHAYLYGCSLLNFRAVCLTQSEICNPN